MSMALATTSRGASSALLSYFFIKYSLLGLINFAPSPLKDSEIKKLLSLV